MTEKEVRQRVGELIKARRLWIGESRTLIASKLGMSPGSLRNWENGSRTPDVIDLCRLAKTLRCKPSELLPNDAKID